MVHAVPYEPEFEGDTYNSETGLYASGYAYTWGTLLKSYTNNDLKLPELFRYTMVHGDKNRSGAYIFENYEDLLTGTGLCADREDTTLAAKNNVDPLKRTQVYTETACAVAQTALGSAWSFADGQITLCGRAVYTRSA